MNVLVLEDLFSYTCASIQSIHDVSGLSIQGSGREPPLCSPGCVSKWMTNLQPELQHKGLRQRGIAHDASLLNGQTRPKSYEIQVDANVALRRI